MARIFVSSTFKDLEECRKKVSLVIRQMGHEDIAMEYFIAENKRPLDKCLEEVASSDLYVGIFAWRYGYRPPGHDSSITELEYRKAVECGKSCLLFLLHEDAPWPRKLMDKDNDASKIEELRSEFSTNCIVSFFETPEDLAGKVGTAIHNWEMKANLYAGTQDIPEIDIQNYTKAIAEKYRNLDIDTLTPIQREEYLRIKLGNVFVEQYVRENLPPFEIPQNVWKRIQEEWNSEKEFFPEGFCAEDIRSAKEKYYSEDPKPIFDVITNEQNKYLVILGDPGSGKSTLEKYILLSVLNIIPENRLNKFRGYVPLLIELRKFTALRSKGKCETFLDYLRYLDETACYDLPVEDVEKYLKNNGKALLIFDGMDEIFDPEEWEKTAEMIAGFKNHYPKINVIVTSRIIGYKNKILSDVGFSHFTIQDFEKPQIETFLDRWYSINFDNKEDIEERKARIFRSLQESKSIWELAGNPLLLTILAIIGKHRELPRERWELYEHAADVLVEQWDINRHLKDKRINTDFIGRDEKKALLMKIAFKMQSKPEGFAGNFIHRSELENEIEEFIESNFKESPSNSKIIARYGIDQLRERNFILCLYGADFFGFVHRCFLEYFCAKYIVTKFDNHELDIKRLKEDYFSKYWKDPAWHEVLSLISGMKEKFARDIIEHLMQIDDPQYFGDKPPLNIVLATKCLSELKNPNVIDKTAKKLLERILKLFEMVRWTQDTNVNSDNIKTLLVSVSKREKEIIRIAAVQLNFKLSDTGFPPQIIDKNQSKSRVLKALKMACDAEVDIVCLPELCICEDWIPEIKDACQNIAVIAGSYYDAEKHNVCQPLLDSGSDVPSQIKIIPSPFEEKGIISQKMIPGDRLHIYDTKVGKFSVLICRDFINLRHQLRGMTDIIFVPSYNKEIKRFHDDANNHINNGPAYIVIANTSLYGGTSVFGRIRKELNSELVDAGYKAKDDGLYKLCELREGEEGLIIADFNLVHKSIQVPTPANPAEDIRPVPYIEKKVLTL